MKVNDHRLIPIAVFRHKGITMLAVLITTHISVIDTCVICRFLMVHLLLDVFGIDHQRTALLIVLDDGIEQCLLLEEIILLEGVQLVEFHSINAELSTNGLLQHKCLISFVGNQLHSDVLHFV